MPLLPQFYYLNVRFKGVCISRACFRNVLEDILHELYLSYDVAVFQWITSCHKNRMTTRVITLSREYVTSLTTSVTTM